MLPTSRAPSKPVIFPAHALCPRMFLRLSSTSTLLLPPTKRASPSIKAPSVHRHVKLDGCGVTKVWANPVKCHPSGSPPPLFRLIFLESNRLEALIVVQDTKLPSFLDRIKPGERRIALHSGMQKVAHLLIARTEASSGKSTTPGTDAFR